MASIEIREEDVALIKMLRKDGVLLKIDPELLRVKNGSVLVYCSDSNHSIDKWNYFESIVTQAQKIHRPFPIPQPGGALWIAESSMLASINLPIDQVMLFGIEFALREQGIRSVFLKTHAPCKAALNYNLSIFDQIELLVKGKERVKKQFAEFEGLEVRCFFHVCYPGQRRETRLVSVQKWYEKIEDYRNFDYTPGRLFSSAAS